MIPVVLEKSADELVVNKLEPLRANLSGTKLVSVELLESDLVKSGSSLYSCKRDPAGSTVSLLLRD